MVGDSPLVMPEELVEGTINSRQTDFGVWVDARAGPGSPSSPDPPCLSGLLRMTLSWVGSPMLAPSNSPLRIITDINLYPEADTELEATMSSFKNSLTEGERWEH